MRCSPDSLPITFPLLLIRQAIRAYMSVRKNKNTYRASWLDADGGGGCRERLTRTAEVPDGRWFVRQTRRESDEAHGALAINELRGVRPCEVSEPG